MTGNRRGRSRSLTSRWSAALGVTLGLLLLAPVSASAGSAGGREIWPSSGASWSNGQVLCVFQPTGPDAAVSAAGVANSGLTVRIVSVEEVATSGLVIALTPSSGMNWTVTNRSTATWYDESYTAQLRVAPAVSAASTIGTVALRVDFLLPISYVEGVTENLTAVTMQLSATGWPWQASEDHLVVNLALAPSYPASEQLASPSAGGTVVASVSTQSGHTLEYFALGTQAIVAGSTGPATATSVAPAWAVNGSSAALGLAIGSTVTEFTTLNYTAHVGVILPATIAGLPLSDYLIVGGSAAVLAALVGVGLRRVRRRPSDLIYVKEEP